MFKSRSGQKSAGSFDRFLLASIGQESRSMPITVLSLFSRLDLDPTVEARILAMLPKSNAVDRLTTHILSLPGNGTDHGEASARANGLLALLPDPQLCPSTRPRQPVTFSMLATAWLCSLVLVMTITLITQWIGQSLRHDLPTVNSAPLLSAREISQAPQGHGKPTRDGAWRAK
jgi:hypothetical protein